MATTLTYTSLQEDIRRYIERGFTLESDPDVYVQIPRLINLAERQIARELKIQGFINVATSNFQRGTSTYPKPSLWRETISVNFGSATSYTTTTREAAAGVRTLTVSAPTGLAVGDTIIVSNVGGTTYNGTFTVTAVTQLTVSYTSGAVTEASTADTTGIVTTPGNKRTPLFTRSYEYLRNFWPDDTQVAAPQFYADYNYDNIIVGPTPDQPYPFEIVYWQLPPLLDDANQTNWVTEYAPDLLLYCTLRQTAPFLKDDGRLAVWDQMYDRAFKGLSAEDTRKIVDRAMNRGSDA